MTSPEGVGAVSPAAQPDPAEAAAQAAATGQTAREPGAITAATTVKSMEDFKAKAPKLYEAMMMGIATNIINQSQHAAERLKKIIRQATIDAQGRS